MANPNWKKGMTPWNKGKKTGLVPKSVFKKGHKHTEEFLGEASRRMKKNWESGLFTGMTGKKMSKETRNKMSESHRLKLTYNWKGGLPNCIDCGKKLSSRYGKTRKCLVCSGRYKGGITPEDRLARVKFREQIQKKVFERDEYKCKFCGSGGSLTVDHIQSWAEYVELRFNMDNCRTLCMKCHYEITFGKPMPPTVRAWGHNLSRRDHL